MLMEHFSPYIIVDLKYLFQYLNHGYAERLCYTIYIIPIKKRLGKTYFSNILDYVGDY